MSKTIVKLRVYKGREVLLKADGKTPANENELITLTYNDLQWKKHLSNLGKMGVCKIEVEKVYVDEKEVEISKEIKEEIEAVLKPATTTLTPEQIRISELEAKIDALLNIEKTINDNSGSNQEQLKNLEDLRKQYFAKFNKEVSNVYKNNIAWIKTQLEA